MDADHRWYQDVHSAYLLAERLAPAHSSPGALPAEPTVAAATGLASACWSEDCPSELAAKSESCAVRC